VRTLRGVSSRPAEPQLRQEALSMKKLRILISLILQENHYQQLHASVAREAARRLGVDVKIVYAGSDAAAQSEQLLKAIQASDNARPDGIICAPVATTLMSVARSAAEAGIGWAVLNRECDYLPELHRNASAPVFFVNADQSEIGRIQGRQIGALLPRGGWVLYILGPAASPIAKFRRSFMESTKPGDIQVTTLTGDWSQQSGYDAVSAWLDSDTSRDTPVNLVAAQCDDMAMGARKAFAEKTAGAERIRWTGLPFIGVDGCPAGGQEWVRRRALASTIINPPTAGPALEMMVHAIQTGTKPRESTLIAPTSFPELDELAKKLAHESGLETAASPSQ
jgi:ABC-type sugar transport system substrate-binding protein